MASDDGTPLTSEDAFVSLYRRYRPGKFSELRGQDHVVRALRSAVRDGHVAHAYLFSGPRGTGKTSTARILAKALNCANPNEGDPCGVCASCIAITKGTSMDVTELDAASNNGVDDVRDLIAHASLGSPGQRKVYIIDEVHMLSNAASNALLKTLEEPPSHVVFVLATTDPQKVSATIRSRTQHLEFRLLGAEVLEGLLRDVRDDAGLALDDDIVSLAVRKGKGSARDALSALDQVAASGETEDARPALLADVVSGIAEEDPARALGALTGLREVGWGPEQLAVELVDDLRQAFLLRVAPELAEVTGGDRQRLDEQGEQLGLARIVRAIELVGRSQVEMRNAPDPLVVFEVAVVRAARSEAEVGTSGLLERLAKLERKVAELSSGIPQAPAAPVSAAQVAAVPEGEKAALGAFARPRGGAKKAATRASNEDVDATPASPTPEPAPKPEPTPEVAPEPAPATQTVPNPAQMDASQITKEAVLAAWAGPILGTLTGATKARFSVPPVDFLDGVLTLTVATEQFRETCLPYVSAVEQALASQFGDAVTFSIVVGDAAKQAVAGEDGLHVPAPKSTPHSTAPAIGNAPEEVEDLGDIDFGDLEDAGSAPAGSVAADKIFEAFPGATETED